MKIRPDALIAAGPSEIRDNDGPGWKDKNLSINLPRCEVERGEGLARANPG